MKKKFLSLLMALCLLIAFVPAAAVTETSTNLRYIEITPLIYEVIGSYSEGLISARIGEKWGFINESGKEVIFLERAYDALQRHGVFAGGISRAKIGL